MFYTKIIHPLTTQVRQPQRMQHGGARDTSKSGCVSDHPTKSVVPARSTLRCVTKQVLDAVNKAVLELNLRAPEPVYEPLSMGFWA